VSIEVGSFRAINLEVWNKAAEGGSAGDRGCSSFGDKG
jgi:hypothetical protein